MTTNVIDDDAFNGIMQILTTLTVKVSQKINIIILPPILALNGLPAICTPAYLMVIK